MGGQRRISVEGDAEEVASHLSAPPGEADTRKTTCSTSQKPLEAPPLTPDERQVLVMASIIAASLIGGMELREFEGARSPRFVTAIRKAFSTASALLSHARSEFGKVKRRP